MAAQDTDQKGDGLAASTHSVEARSRRGNVLSERWQSTASGRDSEAGEGRSAMAANSSDTMARAMRNGTKGSTLESVGVPKTKTAKAPKESVKRSSTRMAAAAGIAVARRHTTAGVDPLE